MIVSFTQRFLKAFVKAPTTIKKTFQMRLKLLHQDFYHPLLRVHPLKGTWDSFMSMNIASDWRAIFKWNKITKECQFVIMGTHSQLYG